MAGPESTERHHSLSRDEEHVHNRWNKDLAPVLRIGSGDLVTPD